MNSPSDIQYQADARRRMMDTSVSVTVLMATYNGAEFIAEQLDSLSEQSLLPQHLVVSDDGSSDNTEEIIIQWSRKHTDIILHRMDGPRTGFAENFRNLILHAPDESDYFAFSDQDDIWLPHKIETAVRELSDIPAHVPALFCGRTRNFPVRGANDMSPLFVRMPSFSNALVQSIAGGNTMVLNRKAFELVRESVRRTSFVSHDWWCYLMVTGAGGVVRYFAEPLILYRQHEGNLVGANGDFRARLARAKMLLRGRFRTWTDMNIAGLDACANLLGEVALKQIASFKRARTGGLIQRFRELRQTGAYRQTWFGQFGLYIAIIFKLL